MNKLYLCPSGVSVLERLRREKGIKNNTLDELRQMIGDFFQKTDDEPTLMEYSAEINSLFRMGLSKDDKVVFLSSDTDESEIVAQDLSKVLNRVKGCKADVKRIKGLQTSDRKRFDSEGIPNLTEKIIKEVEDNTHSFHIILNATSGFKATVPYLTFIGMIFRLPIQYLFERSESIIELPPIPIEFDLERLKQLEPVMDIIYSDYMSKKEFREKTGFTHEELKLAANDILVEDDGLVTLRPTGRILFKRYLQVKGNKVYISPEVSKKLSSGEYKRELFQDLFRKMRDPIHLQRKLHNEVKKKGKIDLDCYKPGSTSERILFYTDKKNVYVCEIFMHDEYERALEKGGLLRENFEKNKKSFKEVSN